GQDFVAQCRAKHRRVSDAMQTAYAGVHLWKEAVERAGTTDTKEVRRQIPGLEISTPDGPTKIAASLYAHRRPRGGLAEAAPEGVRFRVVSPDATPPTPEPFPAWPPAEGKDWRATLNGLHDRWGGWAESKK